MARGFQGMPGGNMQAMARQAQKLQQKMLEMQAELEAREYEATSGGGVVTAKVNGKKELLALTIKPEAVDPDDVEMLEAYILTILTRSILQRKDIDSVIAQLGKRFKSTEEVLTALGISETTAVGSIAREVCFDALGIKDYKVFTRADERVCDVCGPMHGLTFPITAYQPGVTASPFHPRCRCYEIPIRR